MEGLAKIGNPEALSVLTEALTGSDEKLQGLARTALNRLNQLDKLVKRGISMLSDHDERVRIANARVLGGARSTLGVPALLAAIQNETSLSGRQAIIDALGKIGDPVVVPMLIGMLEDADAGSIRAESAVALGNLNDLRAVRPLALAALADGTMVVRLFALKSLVSIGEKRTWIVLKAAQLDTCAEIRTYTQDVLEKRIIAMPPVSEELVWHFVDELKSTGGTREWIALYRLGQVLEQQGIKPKPNLSGFRDFIRWSDVLEKLRVDHSKQSMSHLMFALEFMDHPHVGDVIQILAERGGGAAVQPLLAFALSKESGAQHAVSALEAILSRSAGETPDGTLKRVANVESVFQRSVQLRGDLDFDMVSRKSVDCSAIRRLAESELSRRGSKA